MSDMIKNRYDFVLFFDVKDGNPNGDPDAGNFPRIDAETGMGMVTDVCLKRKVRNYVQTVKNAQKPYDIFIKEKAVLNDLIEKAHETDDVKSKEKKADKTETARKIMCRDYFDVRTFGAVMTTGKNAGQVRGPVQFTFARSVEPIVALEHSITRMAVTKKEDADKQSGMGRKYTVPYGLYRAHGFISPNLAAQTGFSEDDLNLFFESLKNMFDHDHSAARGLMAIRKLIIFKHDSALGNAPAAELFDLVKVETVQNAPKPARDFSCYKITVDNLPKGVTLI